MALDLDAIDIQVGSVRGDKDQSSLAWALAANTLPKVVAELRAVREIIEALHDQDEHLGLATFNALAAYDKVTGEAATDA